MKHDSCSGELEWYCYNDSIKFEQVYIIRCSKCGILKKSTLSYKELEEISRQKTLIKINNKKVFTNGL